MQRLSIHWTTPTFLQSLSITSNLFEAFSKPKIQKPFLTRCTTFPIRVLDSMSLYVLFFGESSTQRAMMQHHVSEARTRIQATKSKVVQDLYGYMNPKREHHTSSPDNLNCKEVSYFFQHHVVSVNCGVSSCSILRSKTW